MKTRGHRLEEEEGEMEGREGRRGGGKGGGGVRNEGR